MDAIFAKGKYMIDVRKIFIFLIGQMFFNFAMSDTYKFHLSDTWYPSKGKFLQRKLCDLEHNLEKKIFINIKSNSIKAIIVPHDGYDYSGSVASSAYRYIQPKMFQRVIILAPAYHTKFSGIAMVGSEYDRYKSPLGHIALDVASLDFLDQSPLFVRDHKVHEIEHSIEVQIPFIQTYCADCKIIPLLVGNLHTSDIDKIADILSKLLVEKTLLVISTDFIHFRQNTQNIHNVLFKKGVVDKLQDVDEQLIDQICKRSASGFFKILEKTGVSFFGKNCIDVLLEIMKKKYVDFSCFVTGYTVCEQHAVQNYISYVGMVITSECM